MSIARLDSKGRFTIPKELREKLEMKGKVLVINVGSHLKIIPLPEDPFRILDGAFNVKKNFRELRRRAEELGLKEASES